MLAASLLLLLLGWHPPVYLPLCLHSSACTPPQLPSPKSRSVVLYYWMKRNDNPGLVAPLLLLLPGRFPPVYLPLRLLPEQCLSPLLSLLALPGPALLLLPLAPVGILPQPQRVVIRGATMSRFPLVVLPAQHRRKMQQRPKRSVSLRAAFPQPQRVVIRRFCVRACVRAFLRACVHACVRACACVRESSAQIPAGCTACIQC